MTNLVYVLNQQSEPLMPTTPARARRKLVQGKAVVVCRSPFTIKLTYALPNLTQPTTLGIDKGSKFTGLCVVQNDNGKILFQGEIRHRLDIKEKMTARRAHRRARRNRKWYRSCRFLNRASSRRSGRLSPSIKTNVEEVLRVVKKLPIPITKIIVEDVLVDIRKLSNPEVKGKDYQSSNRLDENLRLACLIRDNFKCQNPKCKGNTKSLHAHHILWRSKGGKDTITNLITLCKTCHERMHLGKWKLNILGTLGFQDRISQRTMQGKAYLYEELGNPDLVYGYQTAERRSELGLPKTHMIDAFVIAGGNDYSDNNKYQVTFRPRQTRKRYFSLPKKGKGRIKYQVNVELGGFRKGDLVQVTHKKGKFIKRINSIYSNGHLSFVRVKGEPSTAPIKNCILLEKAKTCFFNRWSGY
jgi:hypothetical protein